MSRVLVIGISGTGKTWFAKQLSRRLKTPVINLDTIFWRENWQEQDTDIVRQNIEELIRQPQWIIEGYIEPLANERLEQADTVIYLDYSGLSALKGGIQRWLKYHGRTRPEMPNGCIEHLSWGFLKILFTRNERPEIDTAIKGFNAKIVRIKSRRAAKAYLAKLPRRQLDVKGK